MNTSPDDHTKNHANKQKKVLIAVAWPYVNGDLHIGHLAGYLLPADIYKRFRTVLGDDAVMVSGSDCHGTPITVEAEKRGVSPEEIVSTYHPRNRTLFLDKLGLAYDLYTTTTTEIHKKVTQHIFLRMMENGDIVKDISLQFYSQKENRFLPDRYVEGECPHCGFKSARSDQCDNCGKLLDVETLINPRSKLTSEKVELKESEHYFVDWPKLQPALEEFVAKAGPQWRSWVFAETRGWLENGLQKRAITRDIDWGIPLPEDDIPEDMRLKEAPKKRFYVWFEAVIGYLSATQEWAGQNNKDWKDYWYGPDLEHHYFMGKDNLPFHTLFWPGQLMDTDPDLHLPDNVVVNMFLNFEGEQFSKSRGVTISIDDIVSEFGVDPVRFYLTYIMPETSDSSFSWDNFAEVHNNVLIATLGNYVSRSVKLCQGVDIQASATGQLSDDAANAINKAFDSVRSALLSHQYKKGLESVLHLAQEANQFISRNEVWNQKDEALENSVLHMYAYLIALGFLLMPFLPETSSRICAIAGLLEQSLWPSQGDEAQDIVKQISAVRSVAEPQHLFNKIEPHKAQK